MGWLARAPTSTPSCPSQAITVVLEPLAQLLEPPASLSMLPPVPVPPTLVPPLLMTPLDTLPLPKVVPAPSTRSSTPTATRPSLLPNLPRRPLTSTRASAPTAARATAAPASAPASRATPTTTATRRTCSLPKRKLLLVTYYLLSRYRWTYRIPHNNAQSINKYNLSS